MYNRNSHGRHWRISEVLRSLFGGREGTQTHDLTDVNQVFDPPPARLHGQAVWADREYSGITIRAHYRSVASPRELTIMCRCLEINPDKLSS